MLVLNLVILGLAITLEPIPFTAFALVLASEHGVSKAAFFIAGWILSLAIVVAATLAATQNNPPKPSTAPSTASLAVKILIGAVLLVIALRRRRMMGRPKKPKDPPKWQTGVDDMSRWFALRSRSADPALGPDGRRRRRHRRRQARARGRARWPSSDSACWPRRPTWRPRSTPGYDRRRPRCCSTGCAHWISSHTDQVIVIISGVVGVWLIADSVYLLLT